MRSHLNSLLTEKTLHLANGGNTGDLIDSVIQEEDLVTKNVCAKVSFELSSRIDHIVNLLGVSKRRFLEAAFIEACDQAERIFEEEGLEELLDAQAHERAAK